MAKDFYKHAKAYDIAFSDRDFKTECDFLEWALKKHSKLKKKKREEKSFLELGCGPAKHAREFAKRNWRSVALDLSEEMIEYAKIESEKENIKIEPVVADMSDFKLDRKVVLAAILMESISHMTINEQMISHLKSVAKNLAAGGIYVIEATHPMFFFPDYEPNTWKSKEGNTKVEVTFGVPSDEYNSVTQIWNTTTIMKIQEGKQEPRIFESVSPVRWYLAQEMKALIELSGAFEKYWMYGSMYNIPGKKLDTSEDSDAMVIVLRK